MSRRPSSQRKDSPRWLVIDEWYVHVKANLVSPTCTLFAKEEDARKYAEQELADDGRAQWLFELVDVRKDGPGHWVGKP